MRRQRPDLTAQAPADTSAEPSYPILNRLLRLAAARPDQRVCVAGPQGLGVLLALCRLGYQEVCYVEGPCSSCGDEPCDVLLVTGPLAREDFAATLAVAAVRLRDGGVLAAHEAGLQDDALIGEALASIGREAGWRVHDLAGGCLVAMEVVRAAREGFLRAA